MPPSKPWIHALFAIVIAGFGCSRDGDKAGQALAPATAAQCAQLGALTRFLWRQLDGELGGGTRATAIRGRLGPAVDETLERECLARGW